jgi:hypothetical protein
MVMRRISGNGDGPVQIANACMLLKSSPTSRFSSLCRHW